MQKLFYLLQFVFISLNVNAGISDDHVYIKLDNFKSPSIQINIKRDRTLIRHYIGGDTLAITNFKWCDLETDEKFYLETLKKLKEAGFYSWTDKYVNPYIHDGASFWVVVKQHGTVKRVFGANKYPDGFKKIEAYVLSTQDRFECKPIR